MTEEPLLARWAAALGGLDRLRSNVGHHLVGTVNIGGLPGIYEEWMLADGRFRVDVDLGVIRATSAWDGQRGWVMDRAGVVRDATGAELAALISAAFMRSLSHLVSGRMTGTVRTIDDHSVVVEPVGGKAVTVFIDPATDLPQREQILAGDRTQEDVWDDWRDVQGILIPFSWRQSTGDVRYATTVEVSEAYLDVANDPTLFVRPLNQPRAADSATSDWLPVELNGSHVFVSGQLQGARLSMLLDTGAAMSVIDRGVATNLDWKFEGEVEARGAGEGSVAAAFVSDLTLELGDVAIPGMTCVAMPLQPMESRLGHELHAIIGYDLFGHYVVELDYQHSRMRCHTPDAWNYQGDGQSLNIELESNHPYVTAQLELPSGERLSGRFLVDTGADATVLLTLPFVKRHDLLAASPKRVRYQSGGVGGRVVDEVGRLPGLHLSGYHLRQPIVVFSQAAHGATASHDFAGIIGGQLLRRFTVFFDYRASRMVLEPTVDLHTPFEHDMSGVQIIRDGDAIAVDRVEQGTPAAESGLSAGDLIEAIDGIATANLTLAQIRASWRRDGRAFQLRVRRDGAQREIEMCTRRLV